MSSHTRVTAVTLPTTEPGALDNLFHHEHQNLIEANVVKLAQMPLNELYSTLGCCQVLEWRRGDAKTDGKPKFDLALLDGAFASDQGLDIASFSENPKQVVMNILQIL